MTAHGVHDRQYRGEFNVMIANPTTVLLKISRDQVLAHVSAVPIQSVVALFHMAEVDLGLGLPSPLSATSRLSTCAAPDVEPIQFP